MIMICDDHVMIRVMMMAMMMIMMAMMMMMMQIRRTMRMTMTTMMIIKANVSNQCLEETKLFNLSSSKENNS